MELQVDRSLCEANGVCCALAPEVFALDDDEQLVISRPVPDDQLDLVGRAVERCPKNALELSP
jgi:ferredoxin